MIDSDSVEIIDGIAQEDSTPISATGGISRATPLIGLADAIEVAELGIQRS